MKVGGGKDLVWLALGAVFYGFITVGGRLLANLGFSLIEISLYPLAGVTLILLIARPALLQQLLRRDRVGFFLVYGAIGALLQITQYGGIVLGVPVSLVAMLLYLQPIWTMLLGRLFLGEQFSAAKVLALVLALIGSVVLMTPALEGLSYSPLG
ncbi:MAG TPA: EamA family transporter, partial [Acidobacteriota bacterium]|nr:EamA family transporter [Acidobacteriota bacterium]